MSNMKLCLSKRQLPGCAHLIPSVALGPCHMWAFGECVMCPLASMPMCPLGAAFAVSQRSIRKNVRSVSQSVKGLYVYASALHSTQPVRGQ